MKRVINTNKIKAIILAGSRDFGRCALASHFPTALWPVLGKPVNDEVIKRQILDGGKAMPPYSHLNEKEVQAVIEYLKSL